MENRDPVQLHPPRGLTDDEVRARRREVGENRLPVERGASVAHLLLNQVRSPLVAIILVAAVISLALGEVGDFAIIIAVVLADVSLGFVQEFQAQRTYLALQGLVRPTTTVVRGGERREVEVWELVPGDLVIVAAGDKVPADGALVESTRLAVDEAILTGESEPVSKSVGDRVSMGSTVVTGRCVFTADATGTRTELGLIAASLAEPDEQPTPLQVRLRALSVTLGWTVLAATAVILAVGLLTGRGLLEMLRTAIVLAIAAVPEGLIIAVTVILVLGTRRILHRRGLVKRLLAVETLGSVTVVCTDKTGTLTEGRMRVARTDLVDGPRAYRVMALCNNLDGGVEVALWEYVDGRGEIDAQALAASTRRRGEELFTSETKFMIAEVAGETGEGTEFLLKGAPEVVLGMCAVDEHVAARIRARIDEWAGEGLRLLGLAWRGGGRLDDHNGYAWVGLVAMADPVRDGVPEAIRLARAAGIRVVIVTGDYARTAQTIARAVGLTAETVVEGKDLVALDDERLRDLVARVDVYARIRPEDKLRIVRALRARGEVTAMIGDGVNDAPALRHADIGVVVGTATDVAKETANLILLDSSFATVVAAVEEGRVIFDNIRKVVAYVLSNSFATMLTVFLAMALGWPSPFLVAQILWINLVCDGPPDIVLGFEPTEEGVMAERPRGVEEPILGRLGAALMVVVSTVSAAGGLGVFGHYLHVLDAPERGRSILFAAFAVNSLVSLFAFRSLRRSLFRMRPVHANRPLLLAFAIGLAAVLVPFAVPPLARLLGIVALQPLEWGFVAGFAGLILAAIEAVKVVAGRVPAARRATA